MEKNEIVIYQSQDGTIKVDVLFEGKTVWLTQSQICTLFGKSKSTISEHIKHLAQTENSFQSFKHYVFIRRSAYKFLSVHLAR